MQPHIGFTIHRLAAMIDRSRIHLEIVKRTDQVTGMHGWMIHYLYDHREEDIFQRDIERQFSISRSTVTAILQAMEKNGLLIRQSVPHDARLKKIVLTEKAIRLHHQVTHDIAQFEAILINGISPEELQACQATLEKIRQNLLAQQPNPPIPPEQPYHLKKEDLI